MGSTKAALQPGDIFAIPLFLPSFQEWRKLDELIDYRKYEFPAGDPYVFGRLIEHQPRDPDLELRQALLPFCWLALPPGRYALSLDAGALRAESFAKYDMQGSGYDWEGAAAAFLEARFPEHKGKFAFDCEADTFCITAHRKKALREFALAFHALALDAAAFEALLGRLC